MGVYGLDEVIKRWEKGELTADQAIGQVLQLIQNLSRRMGDLEQRLERQRKRWIDKPGQGK